MPFGGQAVKQTVIKLSLEVTWFDQYIWLLLFVWQYFLSTRKIRQFNDKTLGNKPAASYRTSLIEVTINKYIVATLALLNADTIYVVKSLMKT